VNSVSILARESIRCDPVKGKNQDLIFEPALLIPLIVLSYLNDGLFATRSAYARFLIHEIAVHRTCWF